MKIYYITPFPVLGRSVVPYFFHSNKTTLADIIFTHFLLNYFLGFGFYSSNGRVDRLRK